MESNLPNLLLLTIDTLRHNHISIFGDTSVTTHYIDELAEQGVYFDNCIVHSPYTRASFGSIVTSQYPSAHGAHMNQPRKNAEICVDSALSADVKTLAEILQCQSYHTICFQANAMLDAKYGFARGFDTYLVGKDLYYGNRLALFWRVKHAVGWALKKLLPFRAVYGLFQSQNDAGFVSKKMISFVKRYSLTAPFFVWVNFIDPHCQYNPPLRYLSFNSLWKRERSHLLNLKKNPERTLRPDEVKYVIDKYNGEVRYVDDAIGRIIKSLKTYDLLDNTVIVLLSDHGEEFFDHGSNRNDPDFYHRGVDHGHTLYSEQIRVPLILRFPKKIPAGKRISKVVRAIDVLPTVLDLLEVPSPSTEVEGSTLSEYWVNEDSCGGRVAFSEALLYGAEKKAVTTDRFRLIFHPGTEEYELYDLVKDPCEKHNIWPTQPEEGQKLCEKLHSWISSMENKHPTWQKETKILHDDDRILMKRLRDLGYL